MKNIANNMLNKCKCFNYFKNINVQQIFKMKLKEQFYTQVYIKYNVYMNKSKIK